MPDREKPTARWNRCFVWYRNRSAVWAFASKGSTTMSWCALRFCCHPLPGEHIVGFITRGRGVTVHTVGCPTVLESDPHRKIDVSWEEADQAPRPVKIEVTCVDQPGLLAAISSAITSAEANIARAQIRTFSSQRAINTFEVMIKNSEHLQRVLQNISKVKGVYKAVRGRGRTGGKVELDQRSERRIALNQRTRMARRLFARGPNECSRCKPARV